MHNEKPEGSGEELYRRFRSGDEDAFDELDGLYRESLTLYINSFVKDMYEAEELMIDVFARLDEERGYQGKSSFKTYLFAIARNLALRHVKKRGRKEHVPIEELINELIGGDSSQFTRRESFVSGKSPPLICGSNHVLYAVFLSTAKSHLHKIFWPTSFFSAFARGVWPAASA